MENVCVATYWSPQVNEFLPHLHNEVVFGHEGSVQAFIKLDELTVHLGHLRGTHQEED